MSLFRTFIAVDVSAEVRGRTTRLIKRLQASEARVSWTDPANLHVTLKFLGDTPDAKIPDVCRAVARVSQRTSPFAMSFRGAGAFPRTASPRTVWVGVDDGQSELQEIQASLEEELYALGFARERRRYVPHMTIGRVRGGGATQERLGELVAERADYEAGNGSVDEVLTMASFLDRDGPTYQVLGRADLGSD